MCWKTFDLLVNNKLHDLLWPGSFKFFFFLLNLLNCITENDCMFEALNYKFMHLHTIWFLNFIRYWEGLFFCLDFNIQNISIFRILRQPWVDSLCMLNLIHWSACLLLVNILRLISGVLVYHIILINILLFHLVKLQKFSSLHIDYSIQLRCIHTPLYPSHFEFEYFKQKWKMHICFESSKAFLDLLCGD